MRTGVNDQSSVPSGSGRTPYEHKKEDGSVRILDPASAGFVCPVTKENTDSQGGTNQPLLTLSNLPTIRLTGPVHTGPVSCSELDADPALAGYSTNNSVDSSLIETRCKDPAVAGFKSPDPNNICEGTETIRSGSNPAVAGLDQKTRPKTLREICIRVNSEDENLMIPICINGVLTEAVIDTGAQCTVISERLLQFMQQPLNFAEDIILREAQQNSKMVAKKAEQVSISIGASEYVWDVYVAPLTDNCILGIDFLRSHEGEISLKQNTLTLNDKKIKGRVRFQSPLVEAPVVRRVTLGRKVVVPPNSIIQAKAHLSSPAAGVYMINAPAYSHKGVMIPYSVVEVPAQAEGSCSGKTPVILSFLNYSDHYVYLKKGHIIGNAEEVDTVGPPVQESGIDTMKTDTDVRPLLSTEQSSDNCGELREEASDGEMCSGVRHQLGAVPSSLAQEDIGGVRRVLGVAESSGSDGQGIRPKLGSATSSAKIELPEHVQDLWLRSCKHLNQDQSEQLARVLLEFADQFSKDDLDLGCFAGVDHKIDIGTSNPIRQKMRRTPLGFEDEEK